MARLDGKVAIISGAARGQGAAEAKLFAKEGARVVFGDILDEEGRKVEAEIRQLGGEATYVHLNVTQEGDWRRAVELAESNYGKLDILVNNAGIFRLNSIEETSGEVWDEVMAINAKGGFLGTKCAIPAMRRAGGGAIVNISSISGIVGIGAPAYNASKGAVRSFTKIVAIQHAKDKIRCNSIHSGAVDTPMRQEVLVDQAISEEADTITPLGRIATTEDIAYGVLYLACDESSLVTGSELVIDGGTTAQ